MRHLIVIVPGIGGSVLADADGVVWGDSARRLPGLLAHPDRLAVERPLRAIGLMDTLGFVAPLKVPGYQGLVQALLKGLDRPDLRVDVAADGSARDLGADIVQFPYDFRLGVVPAAERLAAEIEARLGTTASRPARRVIVIGHSMGGLVARCWLVAHPEQASCCAAILTVATPHRGATKALDWLVNGVTVGSGAVRSGSERLFAAHTAVLRAWPGVYDMLPSYRVIQDLACGRHLNAGELAGAGASGFAAAPFFVTHAGRSRTLHAEIAAEWKSAAYEPGRWPAVLPFFARDHGTPHVASLTSAGRLDVDADDPLWQPNPGWRGDGTVPALSAIPPEMAPPELSGRWLPVLERHVPMAGAGAVVRAVRSLVGDDVSAVHGGEIEALHLGVDLEDASLLGAPVRVGVRLLRGSTPVYGDGARVFATVQPDDRSAPPVELDVETAGGGWAATFVPRRAGMWRLVVQAVGQDREEPPAVSDTFAVIDPGSLAREGSG